VCVLSVVSGLVLPPLRSESRDGNVRCGGTQRLTRDCSLWLPPRLLPASALCHGSFGGASLRGSDLESEKKECGFSECAVPSVSGTSVDVPTCTCGCPLSFKRWLASTACSGSPRSCWASFFPWRKPRAPLVHPSDEDQQPPRT